MSRSAKTLIVAEAANPEWASVPLIGWSLAEAMRRRGPVHLVTQIRNREALLRAGLVEGEDFTAIDSEAVARPLWKLAEALRGGEGKGWTMMQAIGAVSYPFFERAVWRLFGHRVASGEFRIVHRITPVSPTTSSLLAPRVAKAGGRFILGPLNGGVPWPREFDAERRKEKEWLSYVRSAYKVLPGREATLKHSAAILVGSRATLADIPRRHRDRCIHLPENGIDPERFTRRRRSEGAGPLRGCFIGRMVPYKGPDMLIRAAAPLLRDGRMTLDMIGDGPMTPELRALAAQEGLDGHPGLRFHGWLDHRNVQDVAAGCDALTFPSIREFGGGVVLEAMFMGLVPVVVDYAGPGELVDESFGVKTPLAGREALVQGFRDALERLAGDPAAVAEMGARARARAESLFTWDRKAEQIAEIHDWALGLRSEKPRPF